MRETAKMDVFELLEDFRLYLVSYWADFYLWAHEFRLEKAQEITSRLLTQYSRQPLGAQIFLGILAVFSVFFVLTKVYMKLSNGVCRSEARLDGKTVLVTGPNSGELFRYKTCIVHVCMLMYRSC